MKSVNYNIQFKSFNIEIFCFQKGYNDFEKISHNLGDDIANIYN